MLNRTNKTRFVNIALTTPVIMILAIDPSVNNKAYLIVFCDLSIN